MGNQCGVLRCARVAVALFRPNPRDPLANIEFGVCGLHDSRLSAGEDYAVRFDGVEYVIYMGTDLNGMHEYIVSQNVSIAGDSFSGGEVRLTFRDARERGSEWNDDLTVVMSRKACAELYRVLGRLAGGADGGAHRS